MNLARTTTFAAVAALGIGSLATTAGASPAGGWGPIGEVAPGVPQPDLYVSDAVAYEADGWITFTIELDHDANHDVAIDWSLVHATTSPADFDGFPVGPTVIEEGESSIDVSLHLAGDDGVEDAEDFFFVVDDIAGIDIHNQEASGRILDGDGPQLHLHNDEAPEGDAGSGGTIPVTVTASYAPLEDVTFRLYSGIFGHEAEAGTDFVPLDEIVTLPAGETSVSTAVQIVGDDAVEDDELLPVYAEDESAGDFGIEGSAELRILDDDVVDAPGGWAPSGSGSGGGTKPVTPFPYDEIDEAADEAVSVRDTTTTTTVASRDDVRGASTELATLASDSTDQGISPVRILLGIALILALVGAAILAYRASATGSDQPTA